MPKNKAVMNWSGGKDSAFALHKVLQGNEFEVEYLLTTVNSHWQRISMHGVRRELLQQQSEAIGIELIEVLLPEMPSMEDYEAEMNKTLDFLLEQGITHSIFGDIFLQDLRDYRENKLKEKGLTGVFPLWQIPTPNLVEDFIELNFKTITVCIDATKLDQNFCGRLIDQSFIADLPKEVDVCGENGEFHTFVFDAPFFKKPIEFTKGEIVFRDYKSENIRSEFYYCDLLPK